MIRLPVEPKLDESMRQRVEWRLVDDLFNQWSVLWIGGFSPACVATVAYVRTGRSFYLGWGLLAILLLLCRTGLIRAFDRRSGGYSQIALWRSRILIAIWTDGGLTGIAGAYAILCSDQLTQILVVSTVTALAMGSAARNNLYPRAASGSILLAEGPVGLACLATGNAYYLLYAAFIVLLTLGALSIMNHLYSQTVRSLVNNEENVQLVYQIKASNRELAAANEKLESDLTTLKRLESQLEDAARRDKLTGLANRALFMERMEGAVDRVRSGQQRFFAVLFVDFDRFKLTNDTLGHQAGDDLLRQIAARLQRELRASDSRTDNPFGNVVSRFGGDEFLLLINDLDDPKAAPGIAERLLNALAPAYEIRGTEVHSSASIGIVTSDQCAGPAEDVVRNADVAMFEAKRAGRACSVVFNESMHTRLARHVTLENALRRAIGTTQLSLVYQPIVDLETGRMVSAEALVRWHHPVLGSIGPGEFIPIAEDSDLIVALGQWVQREACQALIDWMKQDPERAPATISINVSRAELALGSRLVNQIRDVLEGVGLPANRLQMEVTEREVMRDPAGARAVLLDLQSLGVRLAMDDFGTGTSSLSMLRDYPFNSIKIDRSFVEGLTSRSDVLAVIHATITLVENLGMASVAEGVEERSQVAILQSMGCRCAQGYLFSRPVPADALLEALDRGDQPSSNSEVSKLT